MYYIEWFWEILFNSSADVQIYYDTGKRRFRNLNLLIDELKTRKSSFVADESLIDKVIPEINKLRDSANIAAHSIVAMNGINELDNLNIPSQIELLKRYLKTYHRALHSLILTNLIIQPLY